MLRGLVGGAWQVEKHWDGLGQWVRVGVLMVEVVGVYLLAGWGGGNVSWQRRGGRRGHLEPHR